MMKVRKALGTPPTSDGGQPLIDSVVKERASTQHWLLEKAIVDLCAAHGITPSTNRHIDLLVHSGHTSVVFEMKSCGPSDIGLPLRRAVYQLLEYRYLYRDALGSDVRLCVVIERRPRASYEWLIGYLEHLGIGLIWKNDGDKELSCSDFTKRLLADVLPLIAGWKAKPILWK
jgi:hypothetical protein